MFKLLITTYFQFQCWKQIYCFSLGQDSTIIISFDLPCNWCLIETMLLGNVSSCIWKIHVDCGFLLVSWWLLLCELLEVFWISVPLSWYQVTFLNMWCLYFENVFGILLSQRWLICFWIKSISSELSASSTVNHSRHWRSKLFCHVFFHIVSICTAFYFDRHKFTDCSIYRWRFSSMFSFYMSQMRLIPANSNGIEYLSH